MNKYINSVLINEDNFVIKKNNKNIFKVYDLLETSLFDNFPKILDYDDNNIKYEFIRNKKYHEKTQGEEFIKTVSILHYKTLFYKNISKGKYKAIYNKLDNNINYLMNYYENIINDIENEVYMSPSNYLFARNYSLIDSSLKYAKSNLDKWYRKIENKSNQRVCLVHNNLSLNHYIKSDKDYLLSFDNACIDSPILDLYKFYRSEGYKLNFKYLFDIYNENLLLFDEEKILFNVLISIPYKIEKLDNEYLNTINVNDLINYMKNTLAFINTNK